MDQMNTEKAKALAELIKQMQALMADGGGDETMEDGEVSEGIEDAMEESSEPSMEESCQEEEGEEMDPMDKMKQDFMRGKVDRPKRKSLMIMAKPMKPAVPVEKKASPFPTKKKGYK